MINSQELKGKLVVVPGMARSGTTFLYHHFQLHPDILVPARKESAFFSYNHGKGVEWFLSFYRRAGHATCAVDVCPAYFLDDGAVDRIAGFSPDVRVVLGVRRPSDWILSLYGHYGDLYGVPPFRDFLEGYTIHREGKTYRIGFREQVISRTIARYREVFRDRLLIYDFRVLAEDPLRLLGMLESFMGVSPFFNERNRIRGKLHARGADGGVLLTRALNAVPGLATLASRVVPPRVLMAVRRRLETAPPACMRRVPRRTADRDLTDGDRAYAAGILRGDDAYYDDLFKDGPFVRGTHADEPGRTGSPRPGEREVLP